MFEENPNGQTHYDPEAERLARTSAQSDVDAVRAKFEKWYMSEMCTTALFEKWSDTDYYEDSDIQKSWRGYQAGLAAREEPKGWKLVPIEMNGAMLQIMADCEKEERLYSKREAWAALLAAAPSPPEET